MPAAMEILQNIPLLLTILAGIPKNPCLFWSNHADTVSKPVLPYIRKSLPMKTITAHLNCYAGFPIDQAPTKNLLSYPTVHQK